jgi:hypothetical protein
MHDMAHEIEIHEYLGILVKWIEDRIWNNYYDYDYFDFILMLLFAK